MLHHELKKLRSITDSLNPNQQQGENVPAINYQELKNGLEAECERVTETLTNAYFLDAKEEVLERFIQYHQTGLIELADQQQSYLSVYEMENHPLAGIIPGLISRLFALLNYLERFFSKYFNPEEKIPDAYRLLASKELGCAIGQLQASINEKIKSEMLKGCIFDYLQSFSDDAFPANLNFRDMIYLKGFIAELEEGFQDEELQEWDQKLTMTLIYLNFNHLGFLAYYQDSVRQALDRADSGEQHTSMLTKFLSLIKSRQSKPSFSYHPCWPPIKVMLETWLGQELSISAKPTVPEKNSNASPEEKLVLNMSVSQIALWVRLFYDEGCYGNISITDVLKFTARYYRSKRQQHISAGSLGKEYYSVSQVTAAVTKDLLQRMTARINKIYFPVLFGGWIALQVI